MADTSAGKPAKRRLPPWLKRRLPAGGASGEVRALLAELELTTVCDGAHCPNRGECYASGTATFMILGDVCTRHCRFCAVEARPVSAPRPKEPQAVADAAARLGLKYVVITSVTRDDLPDGGAGHFAATVSAVRDRLPDARVEVLIPDFQGSREAMETVCSAGPDVLNHNVETVPRLYSIARPEADYHRSLELLRRARCWADNHDQTMLTKSGLMVGLGERDAEVSSVLKDLRAAGCDVVTIGQYLAPSESHLPVERFVPPEQFDAWRDRALAMGFHAAACGPFVRSSYRAESVFDDSAG